MNSGRRWIMTLDAMTRIMMLFFFWTTFGSSTDDIVVNEDGSMNKPDTDSATSSTATAAKTNNADHLPPVVVSRDCRLVMAPSTLGAASGWGVFTTVDRQRGRPLLFGDVVVQLTDVDQNNPFLPVIQGLTHYYWWSAEETGGFYEAEHVVSSMPGVAMLANGLPPSSSSSHSTTKNNNNNNVLPFVPTVDEGGLTRKSSPGAGAISHYHNYTFYMQHNVPAGQEIFVNYGPQWFEERKEQILLLQTTPTNSSLRPVEWLRQNGRCLDNIRPGRSTRAKDAGRGAFAARRLPKGTIVAPVPVVAIADKRVMDMAPRQRQDRSWTTGLKQLLLNYCFGHPDSSVLLYPYGPGIHLINHGGRGKYANVQLQWSTLPQANDPANVTVDDLLQHQPQTFLLELVALRDIKSTEEILLDYGNTWIQAWLEHLESWKPATGDVPYAPSYVQDDVVKALRTEEELAVHPYLENTFTSCFYRYSGDSNEPKSASGDDATSTTSIRWSQTRGIFELKNLRPCRVLERQQDPKLGTVFTVQIRNRFGLRPHERLPKGAVHIVTHVPRHAIRFSDKLYTTDQHLENAFRHEIGVPDDIFPEHWKNLIKKDEDKGTEQKSSQ